MITFTILCQSILGWQKSIFLLLYYYATYHYPEYDTWSAESIFLEFRANVGKKIPGHSWTHTSKEIYIKIQVKIQNKPPAYSEISAGHIILQLDWLKVLREIRNHSDLLYFVQNIWIFYSKLFPKSLIPPGSLQAPPALLGDSDKHTELRGLLSISLRNVIPSQHLLVVCM